MLLTAEMQVVILKQVGNEPTQQELYQVYARLSAEMELWLVLNNVMMETWL